MAQTLTSLSGQEGSVPLQAIHQHGALRGGDAEPPLWIVGRREHARHVHLRRPQGRQLGATSCGLSVLPDVLLVLLLSVGIVSVSLRGSRCESGVLAAQLYRAPSFGTALVRVLVGKRHSALLWRGGK